MATFEDFWKACPKQVDKALTKARFDALTSEKGLNTKIRDRETGELIEVCYGTVAAGQLIRAMKKYAQEQMDPKTYGLKDGGKYTCTPSVWLNRGRWMDYDDAIGGRDIDGSADNVIRPTVGFRQGQR